MKPNITGASPQLLAKLGKQMLASGLDTTLLGLHLIALAAVRYCMWTLKRIKRALEAMG